MGAFAWPLNRVKNLGQSPEIPIRSRKTTPYFRGESQAAARKKAHQLLLPLEMLPNVVRDSNAPKGKKSHNQMTLVHGPSIGGYLLPLGRTPRPAAALSSQAFLLVQIVSVSCLIQPENLVNNPPRLAQMDVVPRPR